MIRSAQFPAGRKKSAFLKPDPAGCGRDLAPALRRDASSIGFDVGAAGGGRRRKAAGVSLPAATRANVAVVEKEAGNRSHDKKVKCFDLGATFSFLCFLVFPRRCLGFSSLTCCVWSE